MVFYPMNSSWAVTVNSFVDQGKFEAMKMLSDRRAPHCDKHQFHAKMTVEISCIVEHSGLNKKEF